MKKIEKISQNNFDVLEMFFKEVKAALYKSKDRKIQLRMLYGTYNNYEYYMHINHCALMSAIKKRLK